MEYSGPTDLYIGGSWTKSADGQTLDTNDPATEEPYATVELAGTADVDAAVEAARSAVAADSEWRSMEPTDRGSLLSAMADELEEHRDEIASVESHDSGKTLFEAGIEIDLAIDYFRYYAGWTDKIEGRQIPVGEGRLDYTIREPLGVTAHIPPWNNPFQLATRSVAPALATGNAVVLKPAELTPLSALYLGEVADSVGLPDGVLNVVPGLGTEAGSTLTKHDEVDHVTFTGGPTTGRTVQRDAAESVTDVTLELGGKGPAIVFPDADLEAAARGIQYGIFMNAGQQCWATSRLVVHESVHDEVVEQLVEIAESLPLGRGIDGDGRMGPLVSADRQSEVLEYIETGQAEGATLVTGGGVPAEKNSGHYVEPTIFTDVTNDMTIAREEIFGPVLSVISVADEAEALAVSNDSPYGLLAGVWTSDLSRAHTFADRLDYGMVMVNETPNTWPQTPFGGVKQSGHGREQGSEAIREYTATKNVHVNL